MFYINASVKVKRKARLLNCADFRVVEDSFSIGLLSIVFRNLGLDIAENYFWFAALLDCRINALI